VNVYSQSFTIKLSLEMVQGAGKYQKLSSTHVFSIVQSQLEN